MKLKYYSGAQVTSIIGKLPSKEYLEMLNAFAKEPSADVVEVVRCRECKHKAEGQGYCYKHGIWLHRMTFCSEGERRTDDDRNG